MYNGIQGLGTLDWLLQSQMPAIGRTGSGGAFADAMSGAWSAAAYQALSGAQNTTVQSVQNPATISAWGHTDEIQGATLEEMLRAVHPQLTYHVMDCSSSNWIRNDFPHYKLFQQNVNRYEIEHWQPTGEEPTQANSPAIHALSQVAPGSTAVVIHPDVQAKMDGDPEYAREIFERIEAWFAFDEARNAAIAAGHGDVGSGIEKRAIAIGKDGLITNAMAAGGGRLTFSSSGSSRRKEPTPAQQRLLRHDMYMREQVAEQIQHSMLMSQQLNAASLASSAKSKVTAMMSDQKMRQALGEKIGGTPLDTVFDITMQHINQASALGW